jgi:hypothetical protein
VRDWTVLHLVVGLVREWRMLDLVRLVRDWTVLDLVDRLVRDWTVLDLVRLTH